MVPPKWRGVGCGNDGSAVSPIRGSWWGIGWSTKWGACDGSDELGAASFDFLAIPPDFNHSKKLSYN